MKSKRKETEKNNRREALSAIILSCYTVHLVGSEPTTCTLEHTTIYYLMPFIESCVDLQHRAFISADPAAPLHHLHIHLIGPCSHLHRLTFISVNPAPAYTIVHPFRRPLHLHVSSHIHFIGSNRFLHNFMPIHPLLTKKLYHHPVPKSFPLPDAISCPSSAKASIVTS